nr:tyrosine-type recombinase/integrase [Burkholderia ambifaria]
MSHPPDAQAAPLFKSRHGVFYLWLARGGQEVKCSLRTKDFRQARLLALASLRLDQLQREGDVWFFDIQKAKNANSQRQIPLPRVVVESGFLAYVEDLRERGATQLFPELKPGANGYGKDVTRRFADYLDERKITDDGKVFHSFRHTFISRMTELNVHPAMLMALVGHYDQSKVDFSSPYFVNHQHAKPLVELKAAIDRFDIETPICL